MEAVGERLKSERIKQKLTVADVAAKTRINTRFLEAIEANDLSKLPGGFFYKSFVYQYAKALGVDMTPWKAALDEAFQPQDATVVEVPQSHSTSPALGSISSSRWEGNSHKTAFSFLLLVVVIAACGGVYVLWENSHKGAPIVSAAAPKPAEPAPEKKVASEPVPVPVPSNVPQTVVPENTQAKIPEPPTPQPVAVAPSKEEPPVVAANGAGTLNIAATEKAWVSVTSKGKTLFAGVIEPDGPKSWNADEAKLLVGNAGALEVTWQGKPVGPLGPKGQVRIVMLNPGNVDIQNPKKKVQPDNATTL